MKLLISLICLVALSGPRFVLAQSGGAALPTEDQVKGIERLCGGGRADIVTAKGNVDAAIKNWRNAVAGAQVSVAKEQLAGFMNRIKDDANLAATMKVYVDCVDKALQRFLDQANKQPVPVSRMGVSGTLLRSAFASDDEMAAQGCKEAEDEARSRLLADCIGRQLVVFKDPPCTRRGESPRTYVVQVQGECRVLQ